MMKLTSSLCNPPFASSTFAVSMVLLLTACASVPESGNLSSVSSDQSSLTQSSLTQSSLNKSSLNKSSTEFLAPELAATKPFDEDSLYQILVADVALTRGQFKTALKHYLIQARQTRDAAIIRLTHSIAAHQGDARGILESAQLWIEVEPNEAAAHRAALQAFALYKQPFEALEQASWLYRNDNDLEAFLAVTAIDEGNKQVLIPRLMEAYRALPLNPDQQASAELAVAILFRELGDLENAVTTARRFLSLVPDDQRGLLLLAQLLHQQDKINEASALLADALQRKPDDRNLRLQYARFLTLLDRPLAILQFEILREQNPNDQQVNFLLGLLYLNQGNEELASTLFQQASRDPSMRADAQYHLATIAERNGNLVAALQYYQQVKFGRNYLGAASRATVLLARSYGMDQARAYLQALRRQHPSEATALIQLESNLLISGNQGDQAINLLSSGLQEHPNDPKLLYARSMVAEMQNNFALAEQDLRALLAQDEDNPTALNALGYTMILHTDRSEEAYRLIKRAYLLNPGDPAIIDSMGWVLFVMGKAEEALPYLQKAMAILPDPEIAAHLGEVQWFLGDQQAALLTWQRGLAQSPNHPTITDTMQRLGVNILSPDVLDEEDARKDEVSKGTSDLNSHNKDSDIDSLKESASIIEARHREQNQ
jgi:tetratricopeptide (TPR) repeat protein